MVMVTGIVCLTLCLPICLFVCFFSGVMYRVIVPRCITQSQPEPLFVCLFVCSVLLCLGRSIALGEYNSCDR